VQVFIWNMAIVVNAGLVDLNDHELLCGYGVSEKC